MAGLVRHRLRELRRESEDVVSAHTTLTITEDDARILLMKKIMKGDRKMLESMLDSALYETLYNFIIVDRYSADAEPSFDQHRWFFEGR